MWTVALITILVIGLVTASIAFYLAYAYSKALRGTTITRGMNGLAGDTINLVCPAGQTISFDNSSPTTRGAIFCSGDANLDAFSPPTGSSMYNTSNIVDVFAPGSQFTDLLGCEGQPSCSWTVPVATDPRLAGSNVAGCTGQLQFVGTYDCVSA